MRKKITLLLLIAWVCIPLSAQTAYPDGTPHAIPGAIQAVNFNQGGESVAYHDLTTEPVASNPIRNDVHVTILPCNTWELSTYCIGSIETGEWLKYTVNVEKTGSYNVSIVLAGNGSGKLSFWLGSKKILSADVINTEDPDLFDEQNVPVFLTAGEHDLKVTVEEGGFKFAMMTFEEMTGTLPVADLFDIEFLETDGPNGARDVSPLNNPVYDVGTKEGVEKIYPTISYNPLFKKNTAHFTAQDQTSTRGSGAYRVDYVDYSNITVDYKQAPLPFNAIGTAMQTAFSMETVCKFDFQNRHYRVYPFSGTQSGGAGIAAGDRPEGPPTLNWYVEIIGPDGTSKDLKIESDELVADKYYHAIGTYEWDESTNKGKAIFYVDGVKIGEVESEEGYKLKIPSYAGTDALAQWFCIGGDTRRADPVEPVIHVNSDFENLAERIIEGEVVTARIYGRVLTDGDVTLLYTASVPTGINYAKTLSGHVYADNNMLYVKGFPLSASLEVYNLLGQKIAACKTISGDLSLNLPAKGIYIVKVQDKGIPYKVKVINK